MRMQRGVALISVLIVVVIFSALAFQLYSHQTMVTAQTRLVLETSQMRQSLLAGEAMAQRLLYEDWFDEEGRSRDDLAEHWAQLHDAVDTESGPLRYRIVDLNARLNLNAIARENPSAALLTFGNVLNGLGLSQELVPLWRDWVDNDDLRFLSSNFQGREDLDWLTNTPAFRTPNRPAGDVSELRIMVPLTRAAYTEFAQFVTVLPTTEFNVNVNTASVTVLNAMLEPGNNQMPDRGRKRIYRSVESFTDLYWDFQSVSQHLSVQSHYFEVHATIMGAGMRMDLSSQIVRDPSSGDTEVYARQFGTHHLWPSQS